MPLRLRVGFPALVLGTCALLPAAALADSEPPQVTVIYPNGGELLDANTAITVRWMATDNVGVVAVNVFVSLDDGASYQPISPIVANTGQYEWVPANRPTVEALIRVVARDAANNSGDDESDALFAVVPPSGGVIPTTLRDFDLPGSQPFEADIIRNPENCSYCHGNYDINVEPYFNWEGSMMAHASRDPIFEAALVIANQDAPESGDMCLRCHIPNAWLQGRSVPTDGSRVEAMDRVGVSCDFCHRLVDPVYEPGVSPAEDEGILAALNLPPSEFGNGQYVIDPSGRLRGPFTDTVAPHLVAVSPFHQEAALCGTCHDVSNPALERDGMGGYAPNALDEPAADPSPRNLMPLERTYSEWFHSDYNTPGGVYAPNLGGNRDFVSSCQHCHMRAVTGPGCNFPNAPIRDDLPLHDITGGSTWVPQLVAMLYPGEVNVTAIQAGIERARRMLQNAATLAASQTGARLDVTVTNETGHKLPTGYPEGRRVWLNVRFYDQSGALLKESGHYDAGLGALHHDAEAKVYEVELGLDENMAKLTGLPAGPSFHFVLNNQVLKDNRIPPRGFTNAAYDNFGGTPVGAAYADGQYWDDTRYRIPADATRAEIRLYYQSTRRELIEFLRDENRTNSKGQELFDLWNDYGKAPPEEMEFMSVGLTPPQRGDLNCDGAIDAFDIEPFIAALIDPIGYAAAHPSCSADLADVNADGAVDAFDIDPFVQLLTP